MDANIWGLIVVPLGLSICFGPALAVWLKAELTPEAAPVKKERKTSGGAKKQRPRKTSG